jgi:hypothetical protein
MTARKGSMIASRFNREAREGLLYIAAGLEMLVIISITTLVIPFAQRNPAPMEIPEMTVTTFWIFTAMHSIILAILVQKIWTCRRGGRLGKAGLILPGIVLVLMSMVLTEMADVYLDHQAVVASIAIVLFISAFLDLITGIIMIMFPIRIPAGRE